MPAPPPVEGRYTLELLARLVRTPSINPAFGDHTGSERGVAELVARELEGLGMAITWSEPEPDRVSVVGRLRGTGGGRSLLLYAHHDTVGVEGMAEPFSGAVRDGRLYGRGAYDMKGGLAACIGAVRALVGAGVSLRGDVLIASVADEEVASIGMADVLRTTRADAAIVTESTEMRVCLAHKGFSWIEVVTEGRAAHGSRFEEGIDANMRMGRFLARLDGLERRLRASPPHPLVGPPSLHAAVLQGGTGTSTYAARCRLEIERRTIPGETEETVVAELRELAAELAAEDPTFRASVRPFLTRGSFETPADAPIARTVMRAAAEVLGRSPATIGEPYWMDAALLADAGVETVVIGPSGAGAHAAEEWVDVGSVMALERILERAAREWCGEGIGTRG